MATLEELIDELESLTHRAWTNWLRFVRYLKWKQGPTQADVSGTWYSTMAEPRSGGCSTVPSATRREQLCLTDVISIPLDAWLALTIAAKVLDKGQKSRCR